MKEVFQDPVRGIEVMDRFQLIHDLLTETRKHIKVIEKDFFSLVGEEFGDLQVLRRADRREISEGNTLYIAAWKCHCTCGTEVIVEHSKLINEEIYNCGNETHDIEVVKL